MAGDCHNLLTLLKRVRGSGEILQRYGKEYNRSERSTDLPFSSSAEAILASQQGYFPDSNRFGSICFYIFKGDDYTLALPINSPSGAQGRGIASDRGGSSIDHRRDWRLLKDRTSSSTHRAISNSEIFKRNTSLFRVAIPQQPLFLKESPEPGEKEFLTEGGLLRSSKRVLPTLYSLIPRTRREGNLIARIVKGTKWSRADQTPIGTFSQNL